jgi:phosphate uptake regulator
MVFELFKSGPPSQVELIEAEITGMLSTTGKTLQMAFDALARRVEPEEVGDALHSKDRSINRVERSIRRQLVVHAGVRGSEVDLPMLLVYMSIAKDIERVGDIAKDLWDLAAAGADMSQGEDLVKVDEEAGTIARLISDTARNYGDRDTEGAVEILNQADDLTDGYEAEMLAQLNVVDVRLAVTRALYCRYLMRVTAHLMNVLTAVVMPFHRLDYWDEDKIDRE